jgi:hypothetical protein
MPDILPRRLRAVRSPLSKTLAEPDIRAIVSPAEISSPSKYFLSIETSLSRVVNTESATSSPAKQPSFLATISATALLSKETIASVVISPASPKSSFRARFIIGA